MFNSSRLRIAPADAVLALCFVTLCLTGTRAEQRAPGPADVAPPADEAEYDLKYKFQIGDVVRYDADQRVAVRTTIDDTTDEVHAQTESLKAWKVTDVLPSGEIEFMTVVERVHMINQLPDRAATEYDSDKDKAPPPGYEDAAGAIGVPLSVVRITPRGKITNRKIKHQHSAAEDDAQVVVRLPDKPVAIGNTWDEPFEVKVDLSDGGTKMIQTRRHHKLTDVATGIATIEVTYQVLSPIDAAIESQLVQRLMKGTVRFDVDAGRIDSQHFKIDKRILGFAGPTSNMHYVMSYEERLTDKPKQNTARRPSRQRKVSNRSANRNTGRSRSVR